MALPFYLAMTAAEMKNCSALPSRMAWMACHFSPYGTGLSNRPGELPEGSVLILNDRTPIRGHDGDLICLQLADLAESWHLRGILLDFQRPGCGEAQMLAGQLVDALPCPVIVSEAYSEGLDCPVLLPPVPPDIPIGEYVRPYQGREVWLEMAMDGLEVVLTKDGASSTALPYPAFDGREFVDHALHCHYHMELEPEKARFFLRRTIEDEEKLLAEAEDLGITATVGLWQEFNRQESSCLNPRLSNTL